MEGLFDSRGLRAGWNLALPYSLSSCASPFIRNKLAQEEAEGSNPHCVIPAGVLAELPSPICSVELPSHSKAWDLKDLWGSSTALTSVLSVRHPCFLLWAESDGQIEQEL